jgi:isocitrate lyase
MGALTGGQAVQQVKAGIQAIYLSGWQVAADNNSAESMYPDQSLYPVDSVPTVVKRINNSFRRADQIQWKAGKNPGDEGYIDYFAPIVADAEAGFGGVLNAYELMKSMIEAGAAGVHFEDQLASVKKCGHMGGKVLVPTQEAVQKLTAARLAADVAGVPTIILARTDANAADLLTSDCDPYDQPFVTGERTQEGFYKVRAGLDQAIARGLAYAPYADLIWCETAKPDLEEARRFAEAIKKEYPDQTAVVQLLAFLQLEEKPGRRDHRQVPARTVRHGLQAPVHHPGRHSQHVAQHVQPGARLRPQRHDCLREAAGAGIR